MSSLAGRRNGAKGGSKLLLAAEYVRMSTEHQQFSTENQQACIRAYAQERGIQIVRTYADQGRSGLTVAGRFELQRLIADVESGNCGFEILLIYDVSRWGRFQDTDESAYYEYLCRRAGILVAYCAEEFENDGSPTSTIIKSVKRAMASEYSRELSARVFAGQNHLIQKGFRQGGIAGYGLRRAFIDEHGALKGILADGEQKYLHTDRVILVPGPDEEVRVVNDIFHWYVKERLGPDAIAKRLNQMAVPSPYAAEWNCQAIRRILRNEKYAGNNVRNRTSFKLKKKHVINPPALWVRKDNAFAPIVPPDLFHAAIRRRERLGRAFSEEELIKSLHELYQKHGFLSYRLIDGAEDLPCGEYCARRLGGLNSLYQSLGFSPNPGITTRRATKEALIGVPDVFSQIEEGVGAVGGTAWIDPKSGMLWLNREICVRIILAHSKICGRTLYWEVRYKYDYGQDLTVLVRFAPGNQSIRDYYIFPRFTYTKGRIYLGVHNPIELEQYRSDSLAPLYRMASRISLTGVHHGTGC